MNQNTLAGINILNFIAQVTVPDLGLNHQVQHIIVVLVTGAAGCASIWAMRFNTNGTPQTEPFKREEKK